MKTTIVEVGFQEDHFSWIKKIKGVDFLYFNRELKELPFLSYDLILINVSYLNIHLAELFKLSNFILISIKSVINQELSLKKAIDKIKGHKRPSHPLILLHMIQSNLITRFKRKKEKETIEFI